MLIRISHATTYTYDAPPTGVTQVLRLTPRNHDAQYVLNWRVELSADCLMHQSEDAFGNITHAFTAEGPFDELVIKVEGEVDTQDTHGVVTGAAERFPPSLFLRETMLTTADAAIIEFAEAARDKGNDMLATLHGLLASLHGAMTFDVKETQVTTTAAEAFALKKGVCQDITHVYLAAARHLGIPARYVGGHFQREDAIEQDAGHAWAEAFIDGLGWIGFDPMNGISSTDAHVRVAVGLDYLGAAPVRGTRYGGGTENMSVRISVGGPSSQSQSQSQS